MALSPLTLSVTQGVQGRPFQAKINGITAGLTTGRLLVRFSESSPGFSTVNGNLLSGGLPYMVSTVVLREHDSTGAFLDTRIDITAATSEQNRASAVGAIGNGRSLARYRVLGNVQSDGSYNYAVVAVDDLGATTAVSAGGGASAPGAPTISLASVGSSSIVLNWTDGASNGAAIDARYVSIGTSSGEEGGLIAVTVTSGQTTLTGLTGGQIYYIEGWAHNSVGYSPPSSEVNGTPTAAVAISGTPGAATNGTAYSFTPTVTGGSGTRTFALTGSGLPAGLSFSTTTGAITGTPTTTGTTNNISITVTDSSGNATLGPFAIAVGAAGGLVAISGTPGSAINGTAYSFTPTVTGGSGTKTFSLSGSLPTGLSFSTSTGAITGTPTVNGTSNSISITVTDSSGSATLGAFSITVSAAATAATSTFALSSTQSMLSYQPVQRSTTTGGGQGKGTGYINVNLNAGALAGTVQARIKSEDGTTVLQDWFQCATIAAGATSVKVDGIDAGLRWLNLELRDSTGTAQALGIVFGMGDCGAGTGQSLMGQLVLASAGGLAAAGITPSTYVRTMIAHPSALNPDLTTIGWTLLSDSGPAGGVGITNLLNIRVAQTGVIQGFCDWSQGGKALDTFQTGGSNGALVAQMFARGGNKFGWFLFFEGHESAKNGVIRAHRVRDLNTFKATVEANNKFVTDGGTVKWYMCDLPNVYPNGTGFTSTFYGTADILIQIRQGTEDWCALDPTNRKRTVITGMEAQGGIHQNSAGNIRVSQQLARTMFSDSIGPQLVSATRDATNQKLIHTTWTSSGGLVTVGNWWTRFLITDEGSWFNSWPIASGTNLGDGVHLDLLLANDPGPGKRLTILAGASPDSDAEGLGLALSGHTITDNRNTDPYQVGLLQAGRDFQQSLAPISIAEVTVSGAVNAVPSPVAPKSWWDCVGTNLVWGSELVSGFGPSLVGGYAVGADPNGNNVAGPWPHQYNGWILAPSIPSSNVIVMGHSATNSSILLTSAGKLRASMIVSSGTSLTESVVIAGRGLTYFEIINDANGVRLFTWNALDGAKYSSLAGTFQTRMYTKTDAAIVAGATSTGSQALFAAVPGAALFGLVGLYTPTNSLTSAVGFAPPSAPISLSTTGLQFALLDPRAPGATGTVGNALNALRVA